jgi:hypothetical protein
MDEYFRITTGELLAAKAGERREGERRSGNRNRLARFSLPAFLSSLTLIVMNFQIGHDRFYSRNSAPDS